MRRLFDPRLLAVLLCGTALSACTVQEPTVEMPTGPNGPSGPADMKPMTPQFDMARPPNIPPILDPVPGTTVYSTVPVHGSATPGTSVLIKSMDGSTVAADVMSSGRFCADVPLKANTMNTFELRAIDVDGAESDPVALRVQQSGSPQQQQQTGSMDAQNMSIGGASGSSMSWSEGDGSDIIDGNVATAAAASQRAWSTTDYVTVQFSGRALIDHLRIRAPQSCPLTAQFGLYVSNADAPSDPGTQPTAWTLLKMVPQGAANTDYTVTLSTPVALTHVSLYFDRGWVAWGDADVNCGSNWSGAKYGFTDIEAWSVQGAPPPPTPSAPTCTSGAQ